MNTAGSVVYSWGVLVVAAGVSFYYAKKQIDGRRREAQGMGQRPLEKLSWKERIAKDEQGKPSAAVDAARQASSDGPGKMPT
ncbi:uncharacterized protein L203_103462 [Cryptococcus depauperatus CBS 7841]|uniref:Uncharacterized protein n=1 Tax=Cryptococcus depauperatus CBS 7841 TaxID=1295531 RepID=A0A1E3IIB0_9TREE|nr:hypothetical protein L203_02942 [Cryptococcus depauperatus CBS 7841]